MEPIPNNSMILVDLSHLEIKKVYYNLCLCTFQTLLGYLCLDACFAISLHFVSHYVGRIENAGLGLAYTCVCVLVIPMAFGINQSLAIHTSQALGQENFGKMVKRYFTLNFYIIIIAIVPLSALLYGLKVPLSYTIPQDEREQTSDAAWLCLKYLLPANLLAMQFEGIKTFMIAHSVVYPFTFIHIFTTGFHYFFCWLFIQHLNYGLSGAGYAIIITEVLNIIGIILFIAFTDLKKTIFCGISLTYKLMSLLDLAREYVKASIPIIIHIYSEFFVFFFLSFVALSLDINQMNANMAVQNTSGFCFRFPISLQLALMTFIGNEMGKLQISNAKKYTLAGLVIFLIVTSILVTLIFIFREQWANFYTTDPEVKDILLDVLPWMTFAVILVDGIQGTLNGALKGIGKQKLVTQSTLIAYYIVCIPLVLVFTYSWGLNLQIKGIWMAFGISNGMLFLLYLYVLLSAEWNTQAQLISHRVHDQKKFYHSVASLRSSIQYESPTKKAPLKYGQSKDSKTEDLLS